MVCPRYKWLLLQRRWTSAFHGGQGVTSVVECSAPRQGSELGAAASTKAIWWDMRLASLLTHLFVFLFV